MIARSELPTGQAHVFRDANQSAWLGIYGVVEFFRILGAYMANQEMTSYADRSPLPAAALGDRYRRREFAPRGSSRSEKSFATEEIWGQYNNYRSNGLVGSLLVHTVVVGLVLVGASFSHQIVEHATQLQILTLLAPSPDSYALQPNKKIVSGGGGGGGHHPPPAPQGGVANAAVEHITPPPHEGRK